MRLVLCLLFFAAMLLLEPTAATSAERQRIAIWGAKERLGVDLPEYSHIEHPVWGERLEKESGGSAVTQVALHSKLPCLLTGEGDVICWGVPHDRNLRFTEGGDKVKFIKVQGLPPLQSIESTGTAEMTGRDKAGKFWAWPLDTERLQLQARPYLPRWIVENPGNAGYTALFGSMVALRSGNHRECGLTAQGEVWCWPANDGQDVSSGTSTSSAPEQVKLPSPATALSLGGAFCALLQDKSGWCWTRSEGPGKVMGEHDQFRQVAAGENYICAVKEPDGTVWCTENKPENAGKEEKFSMKPKETAPGVLLSGIAHIDLHEAGCAVGAARGLWCWGGSYNGSPDAAPYPYVTRVLAPESMQPIENVTGISVGGWASLALVTAPEGIPASAASISFLSAVQQNDFDRALQMHKENPLTQARGTLADLALLSAAQANRTDIMKIILSAGFDAAGSKQVQNLFIEPIMNDPRQEPGVYILLLENGILPDLGREANAAFAERLLDWFSLRPEAARLKQLLADSLSPFTASEILLPPVWQKPCDAARSSAKNALRFFPVVVEGKYTGDKVDIAKIYKGWRKKGISFDAGDLAGAGLKKGEPALFLAEFDGTAARLSSCGMVFYERDMGANPFHAQILSELALYGAREGVAEAGAAKTMAAAKYPREEAISYETLAAELKQGNDYLALFEAAAAAISSGLADYTIGQAPGQRPRSMVDIHNDAWRYVFDKDKNCSEDASLLSGLLPADVIAKLDDAHRNKMLDDSRQSYGVRLRAALQDLPLALLQMGYYRAALYPRCREYGQAAYIAAAKGAGRKGDVEGKVFERAGGYLANADLGGLVLKKLGAQGAEWVDVEVKGADFTGARFNGANLLDTDLSGARLDMATYDCSTIFPPGFSPKASHMLRAGSYMCRRDTTLAPADLEGISVRPYCKGPCPYDVVEWNGLDLTSLNARSAVLGAVSCNKCKISDADFTGATASLNLQNAEVNKTVFRDAKLGGSRFEKTVFRGVDFTGADLSGLTTTGCTYDKATVFPAGFDPVQAGFGSIVE
jgi:uncharacterized protein YjbI with pentapeptide repeats